MTGLAASHLTSAGLAAGHLAVAGLAAGHLTLAGAAAALALLALAVLDGAFAGFRASAGRNGLIDHRRQDLVAARRGLALTGALLGPVIIVICAEIAGGPGLSNGYARAARAMLAIYGPYGLLVLIALACYGTLGWRRRYLAAAVILGPMTLVRPLVAVLGAGAAAIASRDPVVIASAALAVAAVLAVEPLAGRIWYSPPESVNPKISRMRRRSGRASDAPFQADLP